ncbi:MAG: hypothetical protein HY611_02150 [Elusimicrobia bacterium]|nr:hypothetical protein [Elusimicrobiota bacterium]
MRYKRRRHAAVNKNEQKVLRRGREAQGGSPLGEIYPGVSRLTLKLRFLSQRQEVVSEQTRDYGPADEVDFSCACPGSCGVGNFDLTEMVQTRIAAHEPSAEVNMPCKAESFGSPAPCGYSLQCGIEVRYSIPDPAAPFSA